MEGKTHSQETRLKMSLKRKGKNLSEEHKAKLRLIRRSEETKKKISNSQSEENGFQWKGDKAGVSAMHTWVIKWKGRPRECEVCGITTAKKFEWANVDHSYKRILDDYIRMCTKCHMAYDFEYNNGRDKYRIRSNNKKT